jgi:PAS domain S-box-containing protein
MIVADTEGVIRQWDVGAEVMFGYSAHDAIGQSLDLFVPEHLRDRHWAGFARAMKSPKIKDLAADLPVRCADGQLRSFAGRLLVLSAPLGAAPGAMGIFTSDATTGVHPFE